MKSKLPSILIAAILACRGIADGQTNPEATEKGAHAPKEQPAFSDVQLFEQLGWVWGQRMGLHEMDVSPAELEAAQKGVAEASLGKDAPFDLIRAGFQLDELFQRRQESYFKKVIAQNAKEKEEAFAKLRENPNVVCAPSGLYYEVVAHGAKDAPTEADAVTIHYSTRLLNGTGVEDSEWRGIPAQFVLGKAIPAWREGIQKIGKGGKIILYAPPDLAYGNNVRQGVPPGSALIFYVQLLDFNAPKAQ